MAILTTLKGFFSLKSLLSAKEKMKANWKEIGLALLIGMLVYQNFFSFEVLKIVGIRTVPGLQQEVAETTEKWKEAEESRERLKEEINTTNDQIQEWVDVSRRAEESQKQFLERISDRIEQRDERVEEILEGETPEGPDEAIEFLRKGAEEFEW